MDVDMERTELTARRFDIKTRDITLLPIPDAPSPAARPRPALRLVRRDETAEPPRSAPTRRIVTSFEHAMGVLSLTLFIGSAVALRENVLQDGDGPLFPIGCALFLLSAVLPIAAARRS